MKNWFDIIRNCLAPPTCILCANQGLHPQDICRHCLDSLPLNEHTCYCCGSKLSYRPLSPQLCGDCIQKQPPFATTCAPFLYEEAIRYMILRLKFQKQHQNARLLGFLLSQYAQQTSPLPDLIIPVPLHKKRLQERGFNQSIEIAKSISHHLQIPLDLNSFIRIRNTPKQTSLNACERKQNIKNAFQTTKKVTAQHIAIVDDVMTTGSTVAELSKTILKSGVRRVDVWVCGRAF